MSSTALEALPAKASASARFFRSEAIGSILLLLSATIALMWANSPWSGWYFQLLHAKIGLSWNNRTFFLSGNHWINDGLMALFFFVVGLEIKREVLIGQLSTWKKALLPVAAAVGGMVIPALVYAAFNRGGEAAHGWGIPMATDIAFALGILALFGPRVPLGLKIFLTALAIADDLGSVLVIAIFYTERISIFPLIAGGGFLLLVFVAVRLRITSTAVYASLVIGTWVCVLFSGIHPTVAGILIAMVVPIRGRIPPKHFLAIARERLTELEASHLSGQAVTMLTPDQMEALEQLHQATTAVVPVGPAFERYLHPVTAYVILPLFALFNAGIVLNSGLLTAIINPVALGVLVGLVIGKQAGITAACWTVIRFELADWPEGVTWRQLHGAAILAGIGFTMSLFVSDLAIDNSQLLGYAKVGILIGSAICAAVGFWVLQSALDNSQARLRSSRN